MERETLVRVLVALAILVPLVIEGFTLLGLIGLNIGGNGDSPSQDATPTPDLVGVGGELLPETAATETLQTASIASTGDDWRLTLSVSVQNTDNGTYSVRLASVQTDDGNTIQTATDETEIELAPGESGTVTGQWSLPEGTRPSTVTVVTVRTPANGTAGDPVRRQVKLATIPVQG
jgi:hypothetical protein